MAVTLNYVRYHADYHEKSSSIKSAAITAIYGYASNSIRPLSIVCNGDCVWQIKDELNENSIKKLELLSGLNLDDL